MVTQTPSTLVAEMSWEDFYAPTPTPAPDARKVWREAVAEVAEKAKAALPDSTGRIDSAVKLVLAGDVELREDGTALVGSGKDADTRYHVNGSCTCQDYPRAPQGQCKHKISYGLAVRATALMKGRLAALDAPTEPVSPDDSQALQVPPQFLVHIKGKAFVTFAGLLAMAHDKGLVSLSAHFISVDAKLALAEATAEFPEGRTFMECADATPENVGPMVKAHFPRMALTRAKARALRDALNIGLCSLEEVE